VASRRRSPPTLLLAFATLTALAGCDRGHLAPTSTATIDDTFVIVTATVSAPPRRTPTVKGARTYVVKDGDTLASIAAQFGVAEEAIVQLNGLSNPDDIEAGQVLLIPPAEQ
jgi:LysM repeat protein